MLARAAVHLRMDGCVLTFSGQAKWAMSASNLVLAGIGSGWQPNSQPAQPRWECGGQ